jgi:hypothetical protein
MVKYPKDASEKDKLTIKHSVAKLNTGKTQIVWHIKAKSEIKNSVATL